MAGDVSSSGQAAGHRDSVRPVVPDAPLALYRRYRPATFAEVKGQEHVTEPLRQALRTGRVHHAYLFSGPRGCGKTSSARILARSLNCENGPTPDPCGVCASCVALAPSGPGSIDVIEIDAASHGGIDDARDLRERAFYSPVSARYKIYIIDEAHMVTGGGFNALLKLVEEPPPHLKFVFATTEPEKVIPTIRSRTHHYPFRLVPPAILRELLEEILRAEGVAYEPAVLPVVIRAGAGSVRDSLSVLDQLLAGADDSGLRYDRAIALLGYTDDALLDEIAEAFARADGAAIFRTIDRVVEAGHDPRRFAADLLDRLRDLIVLAAVPDAAVSGLLDVPEDRLERMRKQGSEFGQDRLVRAAETVSAGLVEMRGATSPRLLLELMCAQVLLPAVTAGESDLAARVERLERRASAAPDAPSRARGQARDVPADAAHGAIRDPASQPGAGSSASGHRPAQTRDAAPPAADQAADRAPAEVPPPASGSQPVALDTARLRDRWPDVLESVREVSKVAWILLGNATVESVAGDVLTLSFDGEGYAKGFLSSGYDQILGEVILSTLGSHLVMRTSVQPASGQGAVASNQGAGRASGATGGGAGAADTDRAEGQWGGAAGATSDAAGGTGDPPTAPGGRSGTASAGRTGAAAHGRAGTVSAGGTGNAPDGGSGTAPDGGTDPDGGPPNARTGSAASSAPASGTGAGQVARASGSRGGSAGSGPAGAAGRSPSGNSESAHVGPVAGAQGRPQAASQSRAASQPHAANNPRTDNTRMNRSASHVLPDDPRPLTDAVPPGEDAAQALTGTDLIEQALGGRMIQEITET